MFLTRTTTALHLRSRVAAAAHTVRTGRRGVVALASSSGTDTTAVQQHHCFPTNAPKPIIYPPHHKTMSTSTRKPGVASPQELQAFVQEAGDRLLVVDVRNPDAAVEPGDQKSLAVAALPSATHRPQARHVIWDRESNSLPDLSDVPLDTPIITHCGGGGRGQKAKDFLEQKGYTRVLNGGGPKETDCWAVFGEK